MQTWQCMHTMLLCRTGCVSARPLCATASRNPVTESCRGVGTGVWATQLQSLIQYRLGMTATPVGKRGWSDALKGMQTILQLECKQDLDLNAEDIHRCEAV